MENRQKTTREVDADVRSGIAIFRVHKKGVGKYWWEWQHSFSTKCVLVFTVLMCCFACKKSKGGRGNHKVFPMLLGSSIRAGSEMVLEKVVDATD